MRNLKLAFVVLIIISLSAMLRGVAEDLMCNETDKVDASAPVSQDAVLTQVGSPLESKELEGRLTGDAGVLAYSLISSSPEQSIPNDPFLREQWALSTMQAPRLWEISRGRPGIVIAVLDTGIDRNHEDLTGKVITEVNYTNSPTSHDIYGHGTHIAGIIAANSNNGTGVAGLAPESRLMNVKVADDNGQCQAALVAKGIRWAVDGGASVINISLQLKEPSLALNDAIDYAWSQGAVIVAAAGNDGGILPVYPAYHANCIAVAATMQNDVLVPLSNHGDWVDVAAPGFKIFSTLPDDEYGYKSGTSFATAYVSGLAALLFSVVDDADGNGRLNDEVRAAIEVDCPLSGSR